MFKTLHTWATPLLALPLTAVVRAQHSLRKLLTTVAIFTGCLAYAGVAEAGHYEWRTQGWNSGWYYVSDPSDYSHVWTSPPAPTQHPPVQNRSATPQVRIDHQGHAFRRA